MSNTPTPLSREEPKVLVDSIEAYINQSLKAFADEVEREVIERDEPEEDENCAWGTDFQASIRNELRTDQRTALKALLEKRGIV